MSQNVIIISSIVMLVVGLAFIYLLVGRKKTPQSAFEWFGAGLSVLLILFSGALLILGFTVGDLSERELYDQRLSVGREAPEFQFKLIENDEVKSLSDYRGRVVLLNFWATWCGPCLDEMPDLNRLQADYGEQGLTVLTISDESLEELVAFEEYIRLDTESGYMTDPTVLPMPFKRMLDGRPESYVIDRDGTIREFMLGARDYAYFAQAISPFLNSSNAAG